MRLRLATTLLDVAAIRLISRRVDFTGGLALLELSAVVHAVQREDVSGRIPISGILQVLEAR
jgi:hypothetical protein